MQIPDEFKDYKVTKLPPAKVAQDVENRTNPRDNTFDQGWSPGTLPAWIRRRGAISDEHLGDGDQYEEPNLLAYQNRPASEEPYVDALADFFRDRIERWPGTVSQKSYLHTVMHDKRSTRDIAEAEGVSQPAIVQGRQKALDSFVKWAGGAEALAESLKTYLVARESQDYRDRLKYLPRWVR